MIAIGSDPFAWTPGDAWWDVGVPEVSGRGGQGCRAAREDGRRGSASAFEAIPGGVHLTSIQRFSRAER